MKRYTSKQRQTTSQANANQSSYKNDKNSSQKGVALYPPPLVLSMNNVQMKKSTDDKTNGWPEPMCDLDSVSEKVKKKNKAFYPTNKILRPEMILNSPKRLIKKHFNEYKTYLKDCWNIDLFWNERNNIPEFSPVSKLLITPRGKNIELSWKTNFSTKKYTKSKPKENVTPESEKEPEKIITPEPEKIITPEPEKIITPEKDPCDPTLDTQTTTSTNQQSIPGPSIQFTRSLPDFLGGNKAAVVATLNGMLSGIQTTGTTTTSTPPERTIDSLGRPVVTQRETVQNVRTIIEIDIFTGFRVEGAISGTTGLNNINVMLGRFRNIGGVLIDQGIQSNDIQRGRMGNGATAGVIWNAPPAQRGGNPNLVQFTIRTTTTTTVNTSTTTNCPNE